MTDLVKRSEEIIDVTGPPENYQFLGPSGIGMSNLDNSIDEDFGQTLKDQSVYGQHSAWDFCGWVWWDGEYFCEKVMCYGVDQEVIRANTLENLMNIVNDKYGWN